MMTEAEWLVSSRPGEMLRSLRATTVSPRKLRLFGCACVRRVLHLTPDHDVCMSIEAIEKYVDGLIGKNHFEAEWETMSSSGDETAGTDGDEGMKPSIIERGASSAVVEAAIQVERSVHDWVQAVMVQDRRTIFKHVLEAARASAVAATIVSTHRAGEWPNSRRGQYRSELTRAERELQSNLLRDLIGNPYRPRPVVAASWLRWNDGVVVKLTESIYQDHAFDHMSVLADALEEAGCEDADLLHHCRRRGEHARGCWALDLLLGRE